MKNKGGKGGEHSTQTRLIFSRVTQNVAFSNVVLRLKQKKELKNFLLLLLVSGKASQGEAATTKTTTQLKECTFLQLFFYIAFAFSCASQKPLIGRRGGVRWGEQKWDGEGYVLQQAMFSGSHFLTASESPLTRSGGKHTGGPNKLHFLLLLVFLLN